MLFKKIEIDEQQFIGQGNQRLCYRHPTDKTSCIKVLRNKMDFRGRRHILQEIMYAHHLKRTHKFPDFLPKYKGRVLTNLGLGYIFEVVTDYTGEVSATFADMLEDENIVSANYDMLISAARDLKKAMYKEGILTKSLFAKNISVKKLSQNEANL